MKLAVKTPGKIRNLLFDLGNVLMDIDIHRTVEAFKALRIEGLAEKDIHPHQKDFFLQLELGAISPDEFIAILRRTYPVAADVTDAQLWDAWNALLLDFEPRRFELLRRLRPQYRIFLLSNTNLPHRQCFLERFRRQMGTDFESYFDKCYYSDALRMRKPDPGIYRYVLQDAGIEAQETFFIDDNACNFPGAEALGLNCCHLTRDRHVCDLFE